jgi:hypothetical protein
MSIEKNELIPLEKSEVLKAIKYLEVIRVTLSKIGRRDEIDDLSNSLLYFSIDYNLFEKITFIWKVLQDKFPQDELDQELEELIYWKIPQYITKEDLQSLIDNKNI